MSTAAEAAARFGADPDSVKEVRHAANFLFRFTRDGDPFYLRLAHNSWRSIERIASELALMQFLAKEGIRVVQSVSSPNDEDIVAVPAPEGCFYAVAFAPVPGEALDPDEVDDETIQAWGAALATFHEATLRYEPPQGLARHTWADDLDDAARWLAPEDAAHEALAEVRAWMERAVRRSDVEVGVIHHDFQPDNVLRDGADLWVMDLDDAAAYPLVADLAFALHPYRESPEERRVQVRTAIVEGYRSVRPLSDACVADMPKYIGLRDLWHYAMIDVGHRDAPDLPDWIEGLRITLRDRVGEALVW